MENKSYNIADFLRFEEIIVKHLDNGGKIGNTALSETETLLHKTLGTVGYRKITKSANKVLPTTLFPSMNYLKSICIFIKEWTELMIEEGIIEGQADLKAT